MEDGCLVLDFDGTILDTERSLYAAWAELWASHGHELALADWQQNLGTDGTFDPWAELENRVGRPLDPDLHDRRRLRRDEIQSQYGPRPGVVEWLSEARTLEVPVGIASSSPIEWVEENVTALGLLDFFACLVCRNDDIPAKPEPISYLVACERLCADPVRSVAVEDSPHGVAAAVKAGLFTVAVPHDLTADLDLTAADVVTTSLADLTLASALTRAATRAPGDTRRRPY